MKIIYLGYIVDPDESQKYSGLSVAGNKMQYFILEGIRKIAGVEISIINVRPVAHYPKDRKLFYRKNVKALKNGISIIDVPFINIPIIKQWLQVLYVFRETKKQYQVAPHSILLSFNMYMQVGIPMRIMIQRYKCKAASILADPPINYLYSKTGITRILRNWSVKNTKRNIEVCKNYIVLNEFAIKRFSPKSRYIVVEGGVNSNDNNINTSIVHSEKEKNIVYTGALTEYSGILTLIEAMREITNPNISLHIYGQGVLSEKVRKLASESINIIYYGIKSNSEIIDIQRKAWLLVNPRASDDEIGEVSFPSKIFEYLISGRPVLVTNSNCYSDEYKDILYFTDNNDSDGFVKAISIISLLSEQVLSERGLEGRKFVLNNKTWDIQGEKIYKFLSMIEGNKHEYNYQ